MALHAHNAADRVEQLLILTTRLTALLERETAFFEARTPQKANADADEKNKLANTYRLEIANVAKNPDLVAGAPVALREDLRAATAAFEKALAANNRAANTVRHLTEGLVKAIADETVKARNSMRGYGANGALSASAADAAALTLNRQV